MIVGHRKLLMLMTCASGFMFLNGFAGIATQTENVVTQVEVTAEENQEEAKSVTETVSVNNMPE